MRVICVSWWRVSRRKGGFEVIESIGKVDASPMNADTETEIKTSEDHKGLAYM